MKMIQRFALLMLSFCLLLGAVACAVEPPPAASTSAGTTAEPDPIVPAKEAYYFVLLNSAYLTREDEAAIGQILASYEEHDVFVLDVKDLSTAGEVYTLLQEEQKTKTGRLDGIQIFGASYMVPPFLLEYKVQMRDSYDLQKPFFSDYFYSNLENDPALLENFNLADHFAGAGEVCLTPSWRVARLPLGSGEFSAYANNYQAFWKDWAGERLPVVGWSSSIFRCYVDRPPVDDFATFLSRAESEWGLVDAPRLYANQKGAMVTPTPVLGDCSLETLRAENERGAAEFFVSSHGSKNMLFRTYFDEKGTESRESLLTYEEIASVLGASPYFLTLHSCETAAGLDFHLVRTALNNGCLGAFAATSAMANNGISCRVSLEEMQEGSNFFYFYYSYLKAQNEGKSRSEAFLVAQQCMEAVLMESSRQEVDYAANYQFGYHNLLALANLGILEPDAAVLPDAVVDESPKEDPLAAREVLYLTCGQPTGEEIRLSIARLGSAGEAATVSAMRVQPLDNGYLRFSFSLRAPTGTQVWMLNEKPVNAMYTNGGGVMLGYGELRMVVDLSVEELKKDQELYISLQSEKGYAVYQVIDRAKLNSFLQ
ncbi:MAG: hypothetical protein IJX28_04145 [Clostridia bacterium]|nr:hypothetical protein [Clostridia bacterium]